MPKGRGQKRIKYQGDDTGKELEESTENDIQEEEEILDQGPPKHRRTSETPAREAAITKQETFLQVFKKFMKTRAPRAPRLGKMVRGPTPVKIKIKRIEQGVLGPKITPGKPMGKRRRKGEKGKEPGPGAEKQKRIQEFFEKRTKVQHHTDQGPGETNKNMGATVSSPLLGVHGSPALKTPSKKGRGPKPEERGGGELEE